MKIEKCSAEILNNYDNNMPKQQVSPSFKAGGYTAALNMSGGIMQTIEDGGFLISFLIQDALGMTLPRCAAGFLRDKEVTGHYNKQEGFEVLGREGLTGPCMMAVAPAMLAIAARFGKTTSVNSQLIRRFGNSLKEIVSKPDFDKSLLKNKDEFKKHFFDKNIREMLSNTVGENNVREDSVKYILEQIRNYETIPANAEIKGFNGKKKYRKQCIANIVEHINNIKYETSSELDMLNNLRVGSKELNNIKPFSTHNAIDAMIKYCDDAITLNKHLDTLDSAACENIKDSAIAKRFITNISTMAATLGILSVLPKLYIRNSVSPGARTAMHLKEVKAKEDAEKSKQEAQAGEVSFKGKGGKNSSSILSRLGKFISKHTNEKYSSELEYNGHNFTNTLMAGLSIFGLLLPRGLKAYSRAQVDENGKKDMSEIYEILIRDLSSSLSVVFAVPMLTRLCVTSYENKNGFVLMNKDRNMSKTKAFFDILNPYSKSHVLTNSEISSLYNGVDSVEKMINFCKFIDKNNGDLQKILSKAENKEALEQLGINLEELKKLEKSEKNKSITQIFEKLHTNKNQDKKSLDKLIETLMKGCGSKKGNKIASFARGLNSMPGLIATFLISPAILGWFIPRLTYANTRRMHAKAEEKKSKVNTAA